MPSLRSSLAGSLSIALGAMTLFGASTFACSSKVDRVITGSPDGEAIDPGETPLVPSDLGDPDGATLDASTDSPFETCAATAVEATRERLPVDIIWIVDNSASMQPAVAQVQAGLNDFANLIGTKGLDYKVVMLSKRGATASGNTYPVCIPPPLGGADCGNGPNFFHASMDVKSTQPLEQFLGTLGQTAGFTATDERGSVPWAQELRANATKSIVIVTDDNARLSATDFETFPGGKNPFNSTQLPPGILDPSWNDQFKGYLFNGIYGWGDATDPTVLCKFPDNTKPASSGPTYSVLVGRTGGVRAKLCDGAAAWAPFFDGVAQAVIKTSKVACEIAIPDPEGGALDPDLVNVRVDDGSGTPTTPPKVAGATACADGAGWYYDDPASPKKVLLCPKSCDDAQGNADGGTPKIDVLFGCQTIIK